MAESPSDSVENPAANLGPAALAAGRHSAVRPGHMPDWARPRTGVADGSSGGLIYTLADVDLITPGRLAGGLRVAGTGAIGSDGTVMTVRLIDAKLAVAGLARADVFFAPEIPAGASDGTAVTSQRGSIQADQTIGQWLGTAGYERAGQVAATRPHGTALVPIIDVRKPWPRCAAAPDSPRPATSPHATAAMPADAARPLNPPTATNTATDDRPRPATPGVS
jgi:hypothetical protein